MTRVLLVYHDADVADIESDQLRRAGYEVDRCAGPIGGDPCPILHGEPCWQVEKADVVVYDTWAHDDNQPDIVDELLEFHPDKPLVLTSPIRRGESVGQGRRPPVVIAPTRASLVVSIERALRTRGTPAPATATRNAEQQAGSNLPRW